MTLIAAQRGQIVDIGNAGHRGAAFASQSKGDET
jgi:hypothetical protein